MTGRDARQAGAVTAEHLAVVVVVAAVVAALWAVAVPERVEVAGQEAVDCLFSGRAECELTDPDLISEPGPPPPERDHLEQGPEPPPEPPPGPPERDHLEQGPEPAPTPPPEPGPDYPDDCDLPTREEQLACLQHLHDPYEYERLYAFTIGECTGSTVYAQVPPGPDTGGGTAPYPHDGAAHVNIQNDGTSADGCSMRVRFHGVSQGLGIVEDLGWSEWDEYGHREHGQEITHIEIEVTQPDGSVDVILVRPDDGTDSRDIDGGDDIIVHPHERD